VWQGQAGPVIVKEHPVEFITHTEEKLDTRAKRKHFLNNTAA
jgi:hypothetical protein